MIYSEIKNYLTQIADPETLDLFDQAVKAFERLEFEDYLDVFENAIGDYSDEGDLQVLDTMTHRLGEMVDSILLMHGVTLQTNALLSERIRILQAICFINDLEDKEALLLALESDESDPEVFAQVVAIASGLSTDSVLALIDEISEGVVPRLREFILQPKQEALENTEVVNERITEYTKYQTVFSNDARWADQFSKHSEAIGLPFDSYATLYITQQLKSDLNTDEALAMHRISVNMIGMGCLSAEGSRMTQENARKFLELIYPEMEQLTRLDMKLSSLLLEFNRAQT